MVMRKPPPRPMECGFETPLQKRVPIAASTALPFLLVKVPFSWRIDNDGLIWVPYNF